ncbi:MAG: YjfB family protein [Phycisphaeraceae bacterium]|nr:MAG: YjfB family protein [Phycisphaeraceae bacterium]
MSGISPEVMSQVANADLSNQISVRVARKSLDIAESQGEAMVAMIRAAGEVARPGAPISARPGAGETGGRLDVTG